jgi:cell division protein ZapB
MLAPGRCTLFDRMGVPPHNRSRMSEAKPKISVEQELKQLERRLDELLGTIAQLHEENRALRQRQDSMMAERATLLQKNEQVRARVEAMIGRLKAMEHSA